MQLQSRRKIAHGRCVAPQATIARLETIIGSRHSYWLHQESLSDHLHWTALFLDDEPDFRSMGKGVDARFSHAGALAEAAEWLTARGVGRMPGYLAAHQDELEHPLPIEDLLPHIATATPPVIARIKDLDEARHWVDGWSLRDEKPLKVPLEYVRLIGGPNGKATGNFIEEAIVHAIDEIFERRAHVTVLRERMVVPTIDPETIDNPVLREQLEFVRGRGVEVILKDLSFEGVLPCVGAYFCESGIPADHQFHHFFKVGASFDRGEALTRCFTEYLQGRRGHEFAANPGQPLQELLEPDFRRLRTQGNACDNFLSSFMFGMVPFRDASFLRQGEVVPFEADPGCDDCLGDIARALEICELLGRDLVAVDLSDPEIGFPVVQVVIPGYSDVLPFHPATSRGLFRRWTRPDVIAAY